jgi:hypothetical protein
MAENAYQETGQFKVQIARFVASAFKLPPSDFELQTSNF